MRINVFDLFFLQLSVQGKSFGISMGETFFYLQAGLDIIKILISRIINCLILQTNAFMKILK